MDCRAWLSVLIGACIQEICIYAVGGASLGLDLADGAALLELLLLHQVQILALDVGGEADGGQRLLASGSLRCRPL